MIVQPYRFMFGIVFCMAGVLLLLGGGLAWPQVMLPATVLLMGISLGGGAIDPPKDERRLGFAKLLRASLTDKTRKDFEKTIADSGPSND